MAQDDGVRPVTKIEQRTAMLTVAARGPTSRRPRKPPDLVVRFDAVMARLGALGSSKLGDEAQKELARTVDLLHRVVEAGQPALFLTVEASIAAITAPEPKLALAKDLRRLVARRLRRRFRLVPMAAGLLLGVITFAVAYGWMFLVQGPREGFLGFDEAMQQNIGMVSLTGALGAAVSLMLRVRNLGRLRSIDSEALFYTAFFKPIVGAAFALFVLFALNAGIVNVAGTATDRKSLFAALAFVAGFSERFAKDVIDKVAGSGDDDDGDGDGIDVVEVERDTTVNVPDQGGAGTKGARRNGPGPTPGLAAGEPDRPA